MKKSLINILSLVLAALLLCACGKTGELKSEKLHIRKILNLELEPLCRDESREMMNFMAGGRARVINDTLYTMEFDGELRPCLGAYDIAEGGLENFRILAENCVPEFLNEYKGKLYYINRENNSAIETVAADGSGAKVLKAGPADFLNVRAGELYYTDSKLRLCKSDLEGKREQIILAEGCYYPYYVGEKLLYQKSRNEHLYIYNFKDGSDMEITDIPSYGPVIIDDRFYCTVEDGIYSTNLQGTEAVKYEIKDIQGIADYEAQDSGVKISGVCGNDGVYSWSFSPENPGDSFSKIPGGGYRLCEFRDESYSVYSFLEPAGRIKSFALFCPDGREIRYIKGESS